MYVAKTRALISFAVTAKLICVFVFAYAKKPVFSRCGSFDKSIITRKPVLGFSNLVKTQTGLISYR